MPDDDRRGGQIELVLAVQLLELGHCLVGVRVDLEADDDDVGGGSGLIGHGVFLSSLSADKTSLGRGAPSANN